MKHNFLPLLCFCFYFFHASAATTTSDMETTKISRKPTPYIEAKAGYFFFVTSPMSDVYNQGGLDVQISGAYPVARYLRAYGSVEYFNKSGRSLKGNQHTSIWAVPFSLGIQPVVYLNSADTLTYYVTLGPRYFLTRAHNNSTYVSEHIRSNGWGAFANTGFTITLYNHLKLDFFGEYSYGRLHYKSTIPNSQGSHAQISGLTFGGGLSYAF
jgi:hypothetical protein